jgi:hypothetical protein
VSPNTPSGAVTDRAYTAHLRYHRWRTVSAGKPAIPSGQSAGDPLDPRDPLTSRTATDVVQPYCFAQPPVTNWTSGADVTPASCIFALSWSLARKERSVSKDSAWW